METPKAIERVSDALSFLPSLGKRGASRLSYALLDLKQEQFDEIVNSLLELRSSLHSCPICGMIIEGEGCPICHDKERERTTVMVVSYPKEVISIDNSHEYHGLYHVLNGVINPSKGKGPEEINLFSLQERVKNEGIKEVIIATNPTLEGEITAQYIAKLFNDDVNVTRLGYGLQTGGMIEYLDPLTLSRALSGRTKLSR